MIEVTTDIDLETKVFNLTSENKELQDFAEQTNKFFEKQTPAILAKCVISIVAKIVELGNESNSTRFLPHEDINLFEQISLVALEDDLPIYPEVMIMITNFCDAEIKLLNEHDRFIVSHRYRDFDEDQYSPVQELEDAFIEYASNYTNDALSEYR